MAHRSVNERHYRGTSIDSSGKKHVIIIAQRHEKTLKGRTVSLGSEKIAFKDGRFVKSDSHGFTFNLLGLVMALLLIFSIYGFLSGAESEPKTFYGFLKALQTVPNISLTFNDVSIGIDVFCKSIGFIPILSILADIIWILKPAIVVTVSLSSGVLQLLMFITWVLRYFFV